MSDSRNFGFILKIALFATGCAGIVAEFVLSTLASYLVGNAIFQWTIVMSLMLFAMGLGSRASRYIRDSLLDAFIIVEFILSVVCAMSAITAYSLAAFTDYDDLLIYALAFSIGFLIGLEIPLVTRLNEAYEELRVNISAVMEKDYYGALAGGLIFAFFALPVLGLTYTPVILGAVNFFVASLILWRFFHLVKIKKILVPGFVVSMFVLIATGLFARPIITYGEQRKYVDKVVYSAQTPYQKIVMTRWKNDYWLYINGQEQFSTVDEEKYHEPLVHPAVFLSHNPSNVLIMGGGDGLGAREVLKHDDVKKVTLVDLDPEMTNLAMTSPVLQDINKGSMVDSRITLVNKDARVFIENDRNMYGVIIIDLPDPDTIDLMHVYSLNFYRLIHRRLARGGIMVTQATSPFFSKKAFLCILATVKKAGFSTLPFHNPIPTMGEWGWVMGARAEDLDTDRMKEILMAAQFENIETRYINQDAMISMLHFGKGVFDGKNSLDIQINTEFHPVLYNYYLSGSWGVY